MEGGSISAIHRGIVPAVGASTSTSTSNSNACITGQSRNEPSQVFMMPG